jgi:hypothetical protein
LVAAVRQQGIDQGAVLVAGSRMDHEPGGFVEHDEVGAFV